jgi:hypothetical protein
MKLPKKLRIGPHIYQIIFVKNMWQDADAVGTTNKDSCEIKVDPNQADSQLVNTVIHEALHAMSDGLGKTDEKEEKLCEWYAPKLLQFIQDNKKLVQYIWEINDN